MNLTTDRQLVSPDAVTELLDMEIILKLSADSALRESGDFNGVGAHRRAIDHTNELIEAHTVVSPTVRARMGRELCAKADALKDLAIQLKLFHLAALHRIFFPAA